jgi:hypothetical protein
MLRDPAKLLKKEKETFGRLKNKKQKRKRQEKNYL